MRSEFSASIVNTSLYKDLSIKVKGFCTIIAKYNKLALLWRVFDFMKSLMYYNFIQILIYKLI